MPTVSEYVNQVTPVSHSGLILMEAALNDRNWKAMIVAVCMTRSGRANGKNEIHGRRLAELQ